jgi:folate-dependent phosphoribosylglycinamide formyltransferase PurN
LSNKQAPLKLGWFSTGRGEGSYGLLKAAVDAISSGELAATIEYVFTNREKGQASGSDRFIKYVESLSVPLVAFSSRRFRREHGNRPWPELRDDFDRAVLDLIGRFEVDVTVNAGYMLIAPLICQRTLMINLHPALPGGPIGIWQDVILELIQKRAEESGAMVHIVTEEVDGGPVLSYCRFGLQGAGMAGLWEETSNLPPARLEDGPGQELPLFREIRRLTLMRERPLVVETLKALAERRIDVSRAATGAAVDLTDVVEAAVAATPSDQGP